MNQLDPRSTFLDELIAKLELLLRDAPDGSEISLDRDTLRALVGGYHLAVHCLDDVIDAIRAHLDTAADPAPLLAKLADHGIEISGWPA